MLSSAAVMGTQLRRYDQHRREILVSEALRLPQRVFHLLMQTALIEQTDLIASLCEEYGVTDDSARSLFRTTLAGYFAAAVMMPCASCATTSICWGAGLALVSSRSATA